MPAEIKERYLEVREVGSNVVGSAIDRAKSQAVVPAAAGLLLDKIGL